VSLQSWLTGPLVRHFAHTPVRAAEELMCEAALDEQFSFQVGLRLADGNPQRVRVEIAGPADWSLRVRRVGYVPVAHHNVPIPDDPADVDGVGFIPGYVPDPLFDEDSLLLAPSETHAFWVTIRPGPGATPGDHELRVTVIPALDTPATHTVRVRLHPTALGPRRGFHITHWLYSDALMDWYRTDLFDNRYWRLLSAYVRDAVAHGQDTLYVPAFTPPTDGVKRPTQLLRVAQTSDGRYEFDWQDVKRYVDVARSAGITHFEWCHLFTQWGAQYAIRVYHGQGRDERLLWPPETAAASPIYRAFLTQYLPALFRFLAAEGLLERSFFHVSDEPHGAEHLERYRQARALLRECAPWMRVMDALTDIAFAREGLTDTPIPLIETALEFVEAGIPSWCYYCCAPRGPYLNRLLDTPLPKIAMHGLLFYRWPLGGFLHWGYNYWYRSQTRQLMDPFTVLDAHHWEHGWAFGDPFVVYPGPQGPLDSLRWEVFGESLQDYALLQTLAIARDDPRLAPLRSFADFPKDAAWRSRLRADLLRRTTAG